VRTACESVGFHERRFSGARGAFGVSGMEATEFGDEIPSVCWRLCSLKFWEARKPETARPIESEFEREVSERPLEEIERGELETTLCRDRDELLVLTFTFLSLYSCD